MDKSEYIEVLETVKVEIANTLKPFVDIQKKQDKILEAHNKCLTVTKTKIASAETDIRWLKNYQKLLFSVILGLGGSIGGLIIL